MTRYNLLQKATNVRKQVEVIKNNFGKQEAALCWYGDLSVWSNVCLFRSEYYEIESLPEYIKKYIVNNPKSITKNF
jgi:hypothetical protein